ncbi:hypothetical protein [Pseudobdellovibrio exovorus]|uniref:Uncharacterized protein n=1 Tax=Pseudobdellovibrio exovorus JSS TaxID=1184267 RepID=M4VR80_9BACT|nr:hypothetical protein [Pseudobdellovibrio exovorus]AGH95684.1 hypothetical protein A11Q_1468 [Pseudobdellovibrio exovorus JSS]
MKDQIQISEEEGYLYYLFYLYSNRWKIVYCSAVLSLCVFAVSWIFLSAKRNVSIIQVPTHEYTHALISKEFVDFLIEEEIAPKISEEIGHVYQVKSSYIDSKEQVLKLSSKIYIFSKSDLEPIQLFHAGVMKRLFEYMQEQTKQANANYASVSKGEGVLFKEKAKFVTQPKILMENFMESSKRGVISWVGIYLILFVSFGILVSALYMAYFYIRSLHPKYVFYRKSYE